MGSSDQRSERARRLQQVTPVISGIFFALAAAITTVTGISLLSPGTTLDAMWRIKPTEHDQLLSVGASAFVGFFILAALMGMTSVGSFLRRRWAWWLAMSIFVMNGLGDAVRMVLGAPIEGAVGVAVVTLILFWMSRRGVRDMFSR